MGHWCSGWVLLGALWCCYESGPGDDVVVPPVPDDDSTPVLDDDSAGPGDDDSSEPGDDDISPSELTPPPPPDFPSFIDHLTIGIRTAFTPFSDTNENQLQLCLTDDWCRQLNVPDVNDFRLGEVDIWSAEGVDLAREAVDRVEIRSLSGDDQWQFDCVELRWDGEPVHCQDGLAIEMGNGEGENLSWIDPQGVHAACTTCQAGTLTYGPILGPPEPDAVSLLVRTDATRLVGLRLGAPGDPAPPFVAFAWPLPSTSFQTVLRAEGLQPGTEYDAWVLVDGEVAWGPVRLRTAPPPGAAGTFTMGFGSCSKDDDQPIWTTIAESAADAFFFVGDNHYGNTGNLDAHRWNYRWAHGRAGRREFMATRPILAIWDDHDYTGNNTDGNSPTKAVALRAFTESWPNPSPGTADLEGVFFRWSWGDVDVFGLDDRYWRGFDDSLLGAAQTEWLLAELSQSTATFRVVALGSQWTADGSSDSWAAFLPARDELLTQLGDAGIGGLIFIDGDIHRSEVRELGTEATLGYSAIELTSSPLANLRSNCQNDAELLFCEDGQNSFIELETDTLVLDPTVTARVFGEDGTVLFQTTWSRSSLGPL